MQVPLPELIGQRRALVAQLNALNDQITAIDGLIGRTHLHAASQQLEPPAPKPKKPKPVAKKTRVAKRAYEAGIKAFLTSTGKPAHTRELFQVAVDGGYETSGHGDPYYNFCATLRANKRFVQVGPSTFEMVEEQQR